MRSLWAATFNAILSKIPTAKGIEHIISEFLETEPRRKIESEHKIWQDLTSLDQKLSDGEHQPLVISGPLGTITSKDNHTKVVRVKGDS